MVQICKNCIQPDTRPGVFFSEDGICGACIWQKEMSIINWDQREKELVDIAEWAKSTSKSNYDCVIGVSGGKDSTKQALTARDRLGLRCLLCITFFAPGVLTNIFLNLPDLNIPLGILYYPPILFR